MATRLQTMKKLATEEAKKLKKLATTEEIALLDKKTLNPDDINRCIYGQMTGNCESERAQELIIKCCNKVYDTQSVDNSALANLNGKPKEIDYNRIAIWQSPIEVLIYSENGGKEAQEKIIDFLKGETKTLIL